MPETFAIVATWLAANLGVTYATGAAILTGIITTTASPTADMAAVEAGRAEDLMRRKRIEPFERERGWGTANTRNTFVRRAVGSCMGDIVPEGAFIVAHRAGTIQAGDLCMVHTGREYVTKRFLYADKDGIALECDAPKRRQAFVFDEYVSGVYRIGAIVPCPGGLQGWFKTARELHRLVYAERLRELNTAWAA